MRHESDKKESRKEGKPKGRMQSIYTQHRVRMPTRRKHGLSSRPLGGTRFGWQALYASESRAHVTLGHMPDLAGLG